MKKYEQLKESDFNYNYRQILPVLKNATDPNYISVQIKSDKGATKWLTLDSDFFDALNKAIKDSDI